MENPLKNIQLKDWPDFLLAVSGTLLIASVIAYFGGITFGGGLGLFFGGFFLFALGGKIAHYKYRDPNVQGNSNAWFPGWRHSALADAFATIGIVLILGASYVLYKQYSP